MRWLCLGSEGGTDHRMVSNSWEQQPGRPIVMLHGESPLTVALSV